MKTIIFSFALLLMIAPLFAQEVQEGLDKKTLKKMQKEERRREQDEQIAAKKEYVTALINSRRFVLEAQNISGRTGSQVPVNSLLNFMAVDSSKAVLQVGNNKGVGYNGVGGVTEECRVNRYEINETKNGLSVTLYLQGRLSSYTVFLNASYGTSSTARVSGLTGGVINFHGQLVSMSESRVYKGMSTY